MSFDGQTTQVCKQVKQGFQARWGFPSGCGAIDGTYLPIELPFDEDSTLYYDWKHKLSVSMQAICDHNLKFFLCLLWISGSIQDTRLMRMSQFYIKSHNSNSIEGASILLWWWPHVARVYHWRRQIPTTALVDCSFSGRYFLAAGCFQLQVVQNSNVCGVRFRQVERNLDR